MVLLLFVLIFMSNHGIGISTGFKTPINTSSFIQPLTESGCPFLTNKNSCTNSPYKYLITNPNNKLS